MQSIRRRLTLVLVLLGCSLWALGSGAAYLAMRAGLIAEFDRAHLTDLSALFNITEQSEAGLKFDSTGEYMPNFQRADHPDYFQLWESNGETLYRSPTLLGQPDLPRRIGTPEDPSDWNLILPDGLRGRAAGVRFVPKEDDETPRRPGAPPLTREVILVAAFHRQALDERLRLLGTVLLATGVAMAASTAAAVRFVVRHGLRPLASLGERAGAIDADSLKLRFQTGSLPAELLPIAHRLNDLLTRLDASFTRERRFSADVAHELRTPISELRTLAEVALQWPDDPAATQGALEDALAIARQMEAIATQLMALARCEAHLLEVKSEPVPLRDLIGEISPAFAAQARSKELALEIDLPSESCWRTDRAALRSILGNLLSNAFEYGEPKTAVTLKMERNGAGDCLLLSNINRNLAAEDLPHLFDRFWRKDQARSSADHSGLGLALAKAYSDALGLKLETRLERAQITFLLSGAPSCGAD
ncbi:MAG: ATP-binding protein [Chthoniobacterales bacterium]